MTKDMPVSLPSTPNPFPYDLLATLQQISAFSTNTTGFPYPFNSFAAALAANKAAASSQSQEENNNNSKNTSPLPSLNSTLLQQTPTSTTNFKQQQPHHLLQSPTALCMSPKVDAEQNGTQMSLPQQSVVASSPPNLTSPSLSSQSAAMEGGMTTPATGDDNKPKRRSRLGGSSVKTAEVWRFFNQVPLPEMAATCMVEKCSKTIKATNSSTTGMIRHLRSCHPEEYRALQIARLQSLWVKAQKDGLDENARRHILQQIEDLEMCSPAHHRPGTAVVKEEREKSSRKRGSLSGCNTPQPKHSVEAIIGSGKHVNNPSTPWGGTVPQPDYLASFFQNINKQSQLPLGEEPAVKVEQESDEKEPPVKRPAVGQNEVCAKMTDEKVVEVAMEQTKIKKELKEECEAEVEPENKVPLKTAFSVPEEQQPQIKKRKIGGGTQMWSEDSKETKKISEQIALMLLMDNQSPSVVDRQGFRNFIKSVCPKYKLPVAKTFRDQILPRVRTLLCTDIANLQDQLECNNPFGPSGMSEVISESAANSSLSAVSPANTVESGFLDDREDVENRSASSANSSLTGRKGENFEAVVQNSIRSAQNISQSFSYSIELNSTGIGEMDSDTSSSVCSDMPVQTKIDEFLEYASGRAELSQEELSCLASRCYSLFTNFQEMEHLREELANALSIQERPLDLRQLYTIDVNKPFVARCLAFVVKYMDAIVVVHEKSSIPHFIPFCSEEQQRLSSICLALDVL